MADYYTDFSFVIDKLTNKQMLWWEKKLEKLAELDEYDGYYKSDLDDDGLPIDDRDPHYNYQDYGNPASSINLRKENASVWFSSYDNEGGNIDGMIAVIQEYLTEMDPERIVEYEWISTCSKPRLDAYGGGAVVILSDRVLSKSTSEMLEELKKSI